MSGGRTSSPRACGRVSETTPDADVPRPNRRRLFVLMQSSNDRCVACAPRLSCANAGAATQQRAQRRAGPRSHQGVSHTGACGGLTTRMLVALSFLSSAISASDSLKSNTSRFSFRCAGVGGARDGAEAELHQIAQRHLRGALAVRLADALERVGARHLAARDRHIGDHRHAVLLARRQHLVLVDEGMHLDLVADQRLGGHRPGLVQHLAGEIGDADMLGLAVLLGLAQRADAES